MTQTNTTKYSGYPGVYARVSEAYDWIREEVCRESSSNSSDNSDDDLTPEYFGCPRIPSETETKATTPSPTITNPTTNSPTMAPSSSSSIIKEMSEMPTTTMSPTSEAPTPGISNDPIQMQSISTSLAPTTQFPTPVPTTNQEEQPTDVPTSYSEDEGKTVFIESPTFAPTMGMYVAVPPLVVEEPL